MSQRIIFTLIILLPWLIRTIKEILFHVYLWQLKEYRFDRYWDHLKSKRNIDELFDVFFWMRLVLCIFFFFSFYQFFTSKINDILLIIVFSNPIIFIFEAIFTIYLFFKKKLKRPKFTKKALIICFFVLLLQLTPIIFILSNYNSGYDVLRGFFYILIFSLVLTFLLPLEVFLIVLFFKPITYLVKLYIFVKAKKKMKEFRSLTVIGITGSYGKTSTKEFLATILSEKFNVLKTGEHNNTEIGVANTVLKKLDHDHQIFVVEMGAYKIGEIKTMCDIVKPKIGILTGINSQHLALFGSQENICKGKFELIESLPKDGLAVINFDNEYCQKLIPDIKCNKAFFSINKDVEAFASKIMGSIDGLKFLAKIDNHLKDFSVNIIGKHFVSNLLSAIYLAHYLGMSLEEIQNGVKKIKPFSKTMEKIEGKNGITIVDDSYNANPDSVISALEYLKLYSKNIKKVIVMPGMLELGETSEKSHILVGKKIAEICDYAIFVNKDYLEFTIEGIKKIKNSKLKYFIESDQDKIVDLIDKEIGYNSVVLFESRGTERVIRMMK